MPYRVLVADDNDAVRKVIRAYLEGRADLQICAETTNGRDALDAALALKPDLLILDVVMPELNGIQVATLAKNSLPGSKVILFTLYGDKIGPHIAKVAGVNVILSKPDGMTRLVWTIGSLLHNLPPKSEPTENVRPPH